MYARQLHQSHKHWLVWRHWSISSRFPFKQLKHKPMLISIIITFQQLQLKAQEEENGSYSLPWDLLLHHACSRHQLNQDMSWLTQVFGEEWTSMQRRILFISIPCMSLIFLGINSSSRANDCECDNSDELDKLTSNLDWIFSNGCVFCTRNMT